MRLFKKMSNFFNRLWKHSTHFGAFVEKISGILEHLSDAGVPVVPVADHDQSAHFGTQRLHLADLFGQHGERHDGPGARHVHLPRNFI